MDILSSNEYNVNLLERFFILHIVLKMPSKQKSKAQTASRKKVAASPRACKYKRSTVEPYKCNPGRSKPCVHGEDKKTRSRTSAGVKPCLVVRHEKRILNANQFLCLSKACNENRKQEARGRVVTVPFDQILVANDKRNKVRAMGACGNCESDVMKYVSSRTVQMLVESGSRKGIAGSKRSSRSPSRSSRSPSRAAAAVE